ncbi:hypothetical protein FQN49_006693, partial [Arthroderma sp. PD_2]
METQEDSLDLTYLKNAALGLNESQASLNRHTAFDITRHLTSKVADYGSIFEYGMLSNRSLAAAEKPTGSLSSSVKHDRPDDTTHNSAMSNIKSSELVRSNTTPEAPDGEVSPSGSILGDTQPVSQSVYEGLLDSRVLEEVSIDTPFINIIEGAEGGATQMTLNEGDTGHVDLFSEFDNAVEAVDPQEDNGSQASDMGDSPPTQYEPFPESQRFNTSTPAVPTGRTFSNLASTVTPSTLRNPFGPENKTPGSVMALSQLFNATQAASSPTAHMPRLELPSDMPSPNIPIQRSMRNAVPFSPSVLGSSISRPDPMEPETNYISMKESQTEREKRALRQHSDPGHIDRDDDIFQDGESAIERRIRQMRSKNEARKELENIKAPARVDSRRNSRRNVSSSPPLASLHTVHRHKSLQPVLEDNDDEEALDADQREDSEVETEQEEVCIIPQPRSSQRTQSFGEEDKENVDSGPVQTSNIAVSTHSALSTVLDLDQSPSTNRQRAVGMLRSPTETLSVGPVADTGLRTRPPWASQPETSGNSRDFILKYGTQGKGQARDTTILGRRIMSIDHEGGEGSLAGRMPSSPPIRDIDRIIRSQSGGDNDLSAPQPQASPSPLPKLINQSLPSSHHPPHDNGDSDLQKLSKQSSITSRVFETPSQPVSDGRDFLRTIPETSPAGQRLSFSRSITATRRPARLDVADGVDEDDNLPDPPRFRGSAILQSLGSQELQTTRPSRRVQAILSSPSGRQRRSMTAIASDESPRPAVSDIPINDIRLINAEDRMFQSMIAAGGSPIKRRRGNDGRSIQSFVQSHKHNLANEIDNKTTTYVPMSPTDQGDDKSPKSLQRTPKPPRQPSGPYNDENATDIWEIEVSPPKQMQKKIQKKAQKED